VFSVPRSTFSVRGKRQAESGKRRAASGKRQAASGKRQAESGKRRAASGKRQAASGKRNAECRKRQAASGKRQAESRIPQSAGRNSPWQKSSGFNRLQSRLAASGCIDDMLAIQPASPSLRGNFSLDFGPTCLPQAGLSACGAQAGEYFCHGLVNAER